jgi:hypothetical protein
VVVDDLKLDNESNNCHLPRTCNLAETQGKGARRILNMSHDQILDEVNHRDELAFEEQELEATDNDKSAQSISEEECGSKAEINESK